MASYLCGEEMMGGKGWEAFKKGLAKLDPTSKKAPLGKLVAGGIAGLGTLVGIPPTVTMAGFTGAGAIGAGMKKSNVKTVATPPVQTVGQNSSIPNVPVNMGGYKGEDKKKSPLPLILAAGAAVLILGGMLLIKK